MPRKAREEVEGGVYHVYSRGNNRQLIFRDDTDRSSYLKTLEAVIEETTWRCLSYCLMDNHVHLLLETPKANLAAGMRRLQGDYARSFNDRHDRTGHVFQGRYGAVRIKSEVQLWAAIAYIAQNPVEAGLCERPQQWPWSSHRAILIGESPDWLDIDRLLWHFSDLGGDPRRIYQELTTGIRTGGTAASLSK